MSKERAFFGLRWKVFLNLIMVLAAVQIVYGYYSYYKLTERVEEERKQGAEKDLIILQGLIDSSYDRLLEVAEVIPRIVEEMDQHVFTQEAYISAMEQYSPGFLLNGSIDTAYVYDSEGSPFLKLGINVQIPADIISKVISTEEPARYFYCAEKCLRFVALPIHLGAGKVGVIVAGRGLRDVILDFKSQSGRDIGLAVQQDTRQKSVRSPKLDLKYLTQKADNQMLLNHLVSNHSIPEKGGIFEYSNDGRQYQIVLQPHKGAVRQTVYWILIEEHTNIFSKARSDLFNELLISGIGLLCAAFAQFAFLRTPFRAISDVSEALPLLADSAFGEMRKRLEYKKSANHLDDELDLLRESSVDLSYRLEKLETKLLERAHNLTERSIQLEAEKDMVTSLLDTAETIIMTQDGENRIETLNRFGQELLGIEEADARCKTFLELRHDPSSRKEHSKLLERLLTDEEQKAEIETSIRSGSGRMLQISWLHSVLNTPGGIKKILTIGVDLTDRIRAEKRLAWMVNHDPLTALPNRLLFHTKVDQAIARSDGNGLVAVLFCDLDSFKDVNDSLGHPIGDELLQQAAERIMNVIGNNRVLARLGGDEFTVLLEGCCNAHEVESVAQHIIRVFRQSFFIEGYEIFSTVSVGIALYPDHGDNVVSLIQHSDVAMHEAKEGGKNQSRFYHDEQGSQRYERFSLVNDLRRALDRDEFRVFYQPQIDTRTGNVMGVEALLRWQHSKVGMISPGKFIPLAEEQGLIVPIGEWALYEACRMGKIWHDKGMDIRIGVNLAGQQIMHETLMSSVQQAIYNTGIEPAMLDLEVTENFLLRQPETTIPKLHKFREMGLSLSMDDFGTGFSSLSYLKKLPMNTLKIDQSFVRDIGRDTEDEAIVKAIIVLAKSLGLEVLAEGVETSDQLSFLRVHGCHLIQGFYFSRPLPEEELPAFVLDQAVEISFE